MTIRAVRWDSEAQKIARSLPEHLRREVRDLLAAVATGPVPPEGGTPDADVPDMYRFATPHVRVVAGIYDDEVRVWIVRADT